MPKSTAFPPHKYLSDNNSLMVHPTVMLRTTPPSDGSCKLTELSLELVDHIFQNADRNDLLNAMPTCKSLSRTAERALWSVSDTKSYGKLLTMSSDQQSKSISYDLSFHTQLRQKKINHLHHHWRERSC
jgi:hypothetical protein